MFADKLRTATSGRFQLTTDGFQPYAEVVPGAFGGNLDFAQLIKQYGKAKDAKAETRYSPATITGIRKIEVCGSPDMGLACTSHIERSNLSVRLGKTKSCAWGMPGQTNNATGFSSPGWASRTTRRS